MFAFFWFGLIWNSHSSVQKLRGEGVMAAWDTVSLNIWLVQGGFYLLAGSERSSLTRWCRGVLAQSWMEMEMEMEEDSRAQIRVLVWLRCHASLPLPFGAPIQTVWHLNKKKGVWFIVPLTRRQVNETVSFRPKWSCLRLLVIPDL